MLLYPITLLGAILLLSTSIPAFAVNTNGMRPSTNVEDRRGDSEEGAAGMDLKRNLFRQINAQAKANTGIFLCPALAKTRKAFEIMTNDVEEAAPVRPLLASGKEAALGLDSGGADACGGAQEKMLELSIVARSKAEERRNRFYNDYKQPANIAKELGGHLVKQPPSNERGCAQMGKVGRALLDYHDDYEKVADYLDGNASKMASMQSHWASQVRNGGCNGLGKEAKNARAAKQRSSVSSRQPSANSKKQPNYDASTPIGAEDRSLGDALYGR
jgi:hypothetical protein